ncbi:MAG: NAD(P)H-dependent oxidoreductase subunit E [Actinobacteria bacterium]|nr:NAD(P)H-dependent oxidoreductase subunit E [Actinomycetota bacterium]
MQKCGRHTIRVCHGTACHMAGSDSITGVLKEELNVDVDETTTDGKFTLKTVTCLGCCALAPVMMVDDKAHGRLARDTAKRAIKQYKRHE